MVKQQNTALSSKIVLLNSSIHPKLDNVTRKTNNDLRDGSTKLYINKLLLISSEELKHERKYS